MLDVSRVDSVSSGPDLSQSPRSVSVAVDQGVNQSGFAAPNKRFAAP